MLGIRRYILENIQNLDTILDDLEFIGVTISDAKSQFFVVGVNTIGFICDANKCQPKTNKVLRIIDWRFCTNITTARAFIKVFVYYQILIENFPLIATPICHLFEKNVPLK